MKITERRGAGRWPAAVAVVLACLIGARPAEPGGQRVVKDGKIDLVVYFTYEPADRAQEDADWTPMFNRFSDLLFNATEGKLRIGTLTFAYPDGGQKENADVWIQGPEFGVQRAHSLYAVVGDPGKHITLYQQHKCTGDSAFPICSADGGVWQGQYSVLHESGHYYWGLRDEYAGMALGVCGTSGVSGCASTQALIARGSRDYFCSMGGTSPACCIMDFNPTVSGRNRRTEFCVSDVAESNPMRCDFEHLAQFMNADGNCAANEQEMLLHMACWDAIEVSPVEELRIMAPLSGTVPQVQTVGNQGGPPTVVDPGGKPAYVFVIDNSNSMGVDVAPNQSRLALAKLGAHNALAKVDDDETIGIISFSSQVTTLLQATRGNAGAVKTAATDAINDVGTPTDYTDLGGALQAALAQLQALDPANNPLGPGEKQVTSKNIILFSDGGHTQGQGTPPAAVLAAIADATDVVLHTIAFGTEVAEDIQTTTAATKGEFVIAKDFADLQDNVFPRIMGETQGETSVAALTLSIDGGTTQANAATRGSRRPALPGEPIRVTIPVTIDSFTDSATFILSYTPESFLSNPPHLELVSPSGALIVADDAEDKSPEGGDACWTSSDGNTTICGSGLKYLRNDAQRLYKVPNAFMEAGTWELEVNTTDTDPNVAHPFSILVLAQQPTLVVAAQVTNGPVRYLVDPAPLHVETVVVAGRLVAGADVTAEVLMPGGAMDSIVLHDDGRKDHGDEVANDGVYSALFYGYKGATLGGGSGAYVFNIRVDNVDGVESVVGDRDGTGPPIPVPPFVAETQATGYVTDVPATIPVGTAEMPDTVTELDVVYTDPQSRVISTANWQMLPVLRFALTTTNEHVKLKSLILRSTGTGNEPTLDELRLYEDKDKNGIPDNPSLPLARAVFREDDDPNGVVFASGTVLSTLVPGTANFLITAGPLRAPQAPGVSQKPRPGAGPPPVPPGLFWGTLVGACALLSWIALRNLQSPRAARAVATGLCLALALLVTGSIGCGNGGPKKPVVTGTFGPPPPDPGTYNFSISPADMLVTGATTRLEIDVDGTSIESEVTYTEPPPDLGG